MSDCCWSTCILLQLVHWGTLPLHWLRASHSQSLAVFSSWSWYTCPFLYMWILPLTLPGGLIEGSLFAVVVVSSRCGQAWWLEQQLSSPVLKHPESSCCRCGQASVGLSCASTGAYFLALYWQWQYYWVECSVTGTRSYISEGHWLIAPSCLSCLNFALSHQHQGQAQNHFFAWTKLWYWIRNKDSLLLILYCRQGLLQAAPWQS